MPPTLLLPAVAGDVVKIDGLRETVKVRCDAPSPRGFVCITCRVPLANEYQLLEHIELAGLRAQHVVASVCAWHGVEELAL